MGQRTAFLGVGNTILFAADTADTGGAFALLDYELAPGFAALPPHCHQHEDEAIFILEGALWIRIGEGERLVGQGEFVFLPRGIAHAAYNRGDVPARFMLVVTPAGFEQCYHELEAHVEGGAPISAERIAPILARYGVVPLR